MQLNETAATVSMIGRTGRICVPDLITAGVIQPLTDEALSNHCSMNFVSNPPNPVRTHAEFTLMHGCKFHCHPTKPVNMI